MKKLLILFLGFSFCAFADNFSGLICKSRTMRQDYQGSPNEFCEYYGETCITVDHATCEGSLPHKYQYYNVRCCRTEDSSLGATKPNEMPQGLERH